MTTIAHRPLKDLRFLVLASVWLVVLVLGVALALAVGRAHQTTPVPGGPTPTAPAN